METRLNYSQIAPDGFKAMIGLERYVASSSIEPALAHLIKLRASQINGCDYCIDMHSKDLRSIGEKAERIDCVSVWEETPFYTPREQAALRWTEIVTRISENHAPAEAYSAALEVFSEKELVDLTWIIAAINAWNRMGISFRAEPGKYQAANHKG